MSIVGGLDIHRKQLTFDYLDTATGQVVRGQVAPADREHLRAWLARFAGLGGAEFAFEGCTGWRYVAAELTAAGIGVHLAEPAGTAFARGRKRHAKTDKTDARHLRKLLAEGRLPECWLPPEQALEARALLEAYHDLRREHTAWVQPIHAVFSPPGRPGPRRGHPARHPGTGRGPRGRRRAPVGGRAAAGHRRAGHAAWSRQSAGAALAVYEAGKAHARACAPDHACYAAVKDRKGGKRAALSEARKITRRACHILAVERHGESPPISLFAALTVAMSAGDTAVRRRRHRADHCPVWP
jgi:hypothetical protein